MKKITLILIVSFLVVDAYGALLLAMYQRMRLQKEYLQMVKADSIDAYEGNAEAEFRYGLHCIFEKDRVEGIRLLKRSASKNYPQSIGALAEIKYLEDTDVNHYEAYNLFTKAAALNDTLSICYLGICKYYGHGTKRNYEEAYRFFTIASESKIESIRDLGLYYLSKCYRYGRGTTKNPSISNLILLENNLNSSLAQVILSNLSYNKDVEMIIEHRDYLLDMYTRTPTYMRRKQAQEQKTSTNTSQFVQKLSQRLTDNDNDNDNDNDSDTDYFYYHLVSANGENVEINYENQFIIKRDGMECKYIDKTIPILSFGYSRIQNLIEIGRHTVKLSDKKMCEIIVTNDTNYTYKIEIKYQGKSFCYIISKNYYIKYKDYTPKFGLG